jgi:hypothetical protein
MLSGLTILLWEIFFVAVALSGQQNESVTVCLIIIPVNHCLEYWLMFTAIKPRGDVRTYPLWSP